MTISVVCWLWKSPRLKWSFGADHVNTLRRMVARHYPDPHRFICVTDDPSGIDSDVEIVEPWDDYADVPSPHGGTNPSCYRRLRMFEYGISKVFGDRFVSVDLDAVVVDDLRPLWNRPEDFVGWRDPIHRHQMNGSMMLMTAGARPQVWDDFDPDVSPANALRSGYKGSDQAWISYCLPNEATWGPDDGVYSYKFDVVKRGALPANARIVFFTGTPKPWESATRQIGWIAEHYRM